MFRKLGRIVTAITLVLLAGCGLVPDGLPGGGNTAEAPTMEEVADLHLALQTCQEAAPVTEGVIWLREGTTALETIGLDEFLGTAPMVSGYEYVDEDETYREFQEYFADDPNLLELVQPADLPTSFKVTFAEGADTASLMTDINAFGVVDSVEAAPDKTACRAEAEAAQVACALPPLSLLLWMDPGVDNATVEDISQLLTDSTVVGRFSYKGIEETSASFAETFGDEDEIVGLIDPDQLPTSFEVTLVWTESDEAVVAEIDTLQSTLESLNGVDEVLEGPFQISTLCRDTGEPAES